MPLTPPHTQANPAQAKLASRSADFKLSDYHYDLPDALIAQHPLSSRSDSRMMCLDGGSDSTVQTADHIVSDLPRLLSAGDHLVFNDTRVIPARLSGRKLSGGRLELMLERVTQNGHVLAKIRCSKSPKPGSGILLDAKKNADGLAPAFEARVIGRQDDLFELTAVDGLSEALPAFIEAHGEIPLPPYIERVPDESDQQRYQTVFAQTPGAVAAPTAGLHFDHELLDALRCAGITHSFVTLHVGAGTFQPVRVDNPADHVMHAERVTVGADAVAAINQAQGRGGRIIAVGTTCVRALESAAAVDGQLRPYTGETRLFLTPGVKFKVVDGLFTNFHLPESTLLMLVSAFAGLENTLAAYSQAVARRYRFFSYGDAMLVWPQPGARE